MTIDLDDIADDINPNVYKKLKELKQKKEEEEIEDQIQEVAERQETEIEELEKKGKIPQFENIDIHIGGSNGNGKPNINQIFKIFNNNSSPIDEQELISKIQTNEPAEYVIKSIKKTVKCEDSLIRQILYTGFSTYTEDDSQNLGVLAPTSEGKTYAVIETLQYFPDEDVEIVGKISTMVLVRQKGILIDKKTGEPIKDKLQELRIKFRDLVKKRNKLSRKDDDVDERENINDEMDKVSEDIRNLIDNSKTLIDLRDKILVFLEPPKPELWELLKPILSHDKKEISFPFVDKTANSNAETKDVVIRGWPACIFCSAKDESKSPIWEEIKSRIITTSPNMVPEKYKASKKLIAQKKGLPNLIQQQIIISDEQVENTKKCILLIKDKINQLKYKNPSKKISTWIPYRDLLDAELPANKGPDVRFANKVFSFLNIVPIVKSDLRMVLNMEGESSIIADLQDLKEVLSIAQNLDGLPKFKADFFNKILLPCYAKKTEPESKVDDKGKKTEEEVLAVTSREICNYFKEINKKPISTDNMKHTYLNQLINEGLIDYTQSKIHGRQNIYYPLVTESLSIPSIINPIDKESQQNSTIYEKIIKNITEGWIFHEIIGLICYRLGYRDNEDNQIIIEESDKFQVVEYIKDPEKFQILNNNYVSKEEEGSRKSPLNTSEFIKHYSHISKTPIDNKPSNILASFAKTSHFLSILDKIDSIDKKVIDNFLSTNHMKKVEEDKEKEL